MERSAPVLASLDELFAEPDLPQALRDCEDDRDDGLAAAARQLAGAGHLAVKGIVRGLSWLAALVRDDQTAWRELSGSCQVRESLLALGDGRSNLHKQD